MSHPYVPLGTPVTITVDGFWDGDHNGNQPVIVVPNGQGENKKYHVPHGALVQTKPEEVEAVEFAVDKTPKPQPTYPDFSEPKLRVFRDNYNLTWWEIEPDKFYPADTRTNAEASAKAWPKDCRDMAYLEEHYTLTDVTDTGEPLDAGNPFEDASGLIWYPHLTKDKYCNGSDCPARTRTEASDHCQHGLTGSEVIHRYGFRRVVEDTPRKPEPGDRVRVKTPNGNTFEGMYVTEYRAGKDQVSVVEDDCILTVTGHPEDLVWEVIEPARPAVPEDPQCDVEEEAGCDVLPWRYTGSRYCDDRGQCLTWKRLWATSQEIGSKLYPIRYERGPEIGG
jgi:hypothetical protein